VFADAIAHGFGNRIGHTLLSLHYGQRVTCLFYQYLGRKFLEATVKKQLLRKFPNQRIQQLPRRIANKADQKNKQTDT
jgi:hypothetical protein